MKQLVDLLHTLCCSGNHISDMMKINDRHLGCCYYYLENDISGGDTMADHIKWYETYADFKILMNLKSDEEARAFLKTSIEISQRIRTLSSSSPERLGFIKSLIP